MRKKQTSTWFKKKRFPVHSRRSLIVVAIVFGVLGSVVIGWSKAATNNFDNVVTDPINPAYLTDIPFGTRSDWVQPWRAYMDTVPVSNLLDAVGVNFNISGNSIEPTARILAANGFKHARIEFGWNSIDYNDPTKMSATSQQKLQQLLTTFKQYGIRPLVLLNANSGGPVPSKSFSLTVTQAAKAGDRTIKIDPAIASQLVYGYSGSKFTDSKAPQAKYRFLSMTPDGTVTLSYPLAVDVPAGAYANAGTTQKFQPFFPEKKDNGQPSPEFNQTMNGWLDYVGAVTKATKQYYGSDDFDLEVWNELSFGSAFLGANNYFSPMPAGYTSKIDSRSSILNGTIDYIRNPANGVPNIKIGSGFTNQSPWGSGQNQPPGLTAIDKHPYSGPLYRPYQGQGGTPIDALGEPDPTAVLSCVQSTNHTIHTPWTDANANGKLDTKDVCSGGFIGMISPKEPTYNQIMPEAFLNGVTTETLIRDLAPFDNSIQGGVHGRYSKACDTCTPPVMWVTEVNLSSGAGQAVSDPKKPGTYLYNARTPQESAHFAAKNYLRYLVSYVNKGAKVIDFYAAKSDDLGVIDQSYFDQLTAGGINQNPSFYPGNNSGGVSLAAINNLVNIMKQGAGPITQPKHLTLDKIADNHNNKQFEKTDDTPAHAPLYDRDVLAVFPFQVSDTRFAIPAYVMTRDTAKIYNPNAPNTTGARFDMPPEAFQITLGGFGTGKTLSATAIDPLTNTATPVSIISQSGGTVVLQADLTDSPRIIMIDAADGSGTPAPVDTTPPDTIITIGPSGSREKTAATYSFTSTENGATFECKMDSGNYSACTSPKTYTGITPGTHVFSVRSIDAAGNVDGSPATFSFTFTAPQDAVAPSAPANLLATAPNSVVVALSWAASSDTGGSGLAGYNIYRNGVKVNGTPITGTTYNDVTVSSNTNYSYTVEAVDVAGNKSAQSAAGVVKTPQTPGGKRGDVTGQANQPDGKIDLFDLSYFIRNYNTSNLNADVTGPDNKPDGKVDIFDLSYVIRNYGQ